MIFEPSFMLTLKCRNVPSPEEYIPAYVIVRQKFLHRVWYVKFVHTF